MGKKSPIVHNPPLPRNYSADLLVLERGEGVYVEDAAGNRYLDFGAGIAVNTLGYGREDLAAIAAAQMRKLIHTSNLYATNPSLSFAGTLVASGPFAAVHFGNSGTEANEAAIKYARLYAARTKGRGHHKLLCFDGAFHGRTMGALSVTPNKHYQDPFRPLISGVATLPYNDAAALEKKLDGSFAAVMVEIVQGEGGLRVMTREFARALNALCRKHDVILIDDEVQTGIGRVGSLYAYAQVGLKPDIVTLAKPIAGGLPLSATLIPKRINDLLKPGDHGSTFGGGPVTTAVAAHIWKTISRDKFLADLREKADYLAGELTALRKRFSWLGELRGMGMLRGLPVEVPAPGQTAAVSTLLAAARDEGVLILRSGANVLRVAPPLTITKKEIREGVSRLASAFEKATPRL